MRLRVSPSLALRLLGTRGERMSPAAAGGNFTASRYVDPGTSVPEPRPCNSIAAA